MMCVVCIGWAWAVCQKKYIYILSLILLIPLAKQKMDICRNRILYPLWLGPPFPNDAQALRPNASLEPNQISNWLEECGNGKYNLLNEQKSIFENKMTKVSDKNAKCHIFLPKCLVFYIYLCLNVLIILIFWFRMQMKALSSKCS